MTSPEIEYPCDWRYRLIGGSTESIREAVETVLGERDHDLSPARESRGGRYVSMTLSVVVESEADRMAIYEGLHSSEAVRMVL